MTPRLFSYFRSSAAYRVRIALGLKQIEYEYVAVHLPSGVHRETEFDAVNPQRLVPVLEREGERLNQSLAIIEYLDEIKPEPRLLPSSIRDRATVRAMAQIIACDMHPLCNLRVLKYLSGSLGHDQKTIHAWYAHWMAEGFSGLEAMLERHGSLSRCFGDALSLADVCLVPQVYNAKRFNCDLTPFPAVLRIAAALDALPAFAAARPEAQPDAE